MYLLIGQVFSSLSALAWLDFDPTLSSSFLLFLTLCCLCKAILHIVLSFLGMFQLALIAIVVQTHHEMKRPSRISAETLKPAGEQIKSKKKKLMNHGYTNPRIYIVMV